MMLSVIVVITCKWLVVVFVLVRYELGRQPANTKLSSNKTVRRVRVRGGNVKWRALRLDTGNYSWGSEAVTRKTRILDVVYNASNNELVRTQTLVKGAIVQVDAAPFKQWYLQHYGVEIGRKKKTAAKKEGEVNFCFLCPRISVSSCFYSIALVSLHCAAYCRYTSVLSLWLHVKKGIVGCMN